MTKLELEARVQELENELSLAHETITAKDEIIENLEIEKRNLASANSENASKYVSAKDENYRLKKELEEARNRVRVLESQSKPTHEPVNSKELEETIKNLDKEVILRNQHILKQNAFISRFIDTLKNVVDSNQEHYSFLVKEIENTYKK